MVAGPEASNPAPFSLKPGRVWLRESQDLLPSPIADHGESQEIWKDSVMVLDGALSWDSLLIPEFGRKLVVRSRVTEP